MKFNEIFNSPKGGNHLIQNPNIKGQDKHTKVYCHEPYAQTLFDLYMGKNSKVIKKDLELGECIQITDIFNVNEEVMTVELEGGLNVDIDLTREKRFIQLFGHESISSFVETIKRAIIRKDFLGQGLYAYVTDVEPTLRVSLWYGYIQKVKEEFTEQIKSPSKAYEANILECNKGGYFVEVQGVEAFMPGSLAAPNKLVDFRVLLGKKVIVMIEDYIPEMNSFIVSHKKYINHILPIKIKELDLEKEYEGTITGTSKFGIFIEFDDIFTGLLHVSKMKDKTLNYFKKYKFKAGNSIKFFINEITKDERIILTEESPIEKRKKLEDFVIKNETKILEAEVAAIMNFGLIVNVDEISGLIPNKEFRRRKITKDYVIGDLIKVKLGDFKDKKVIFRLVKEKNTPEVVEEKETTV